MEKTLRVIWRQQGNVQWEEWWVTKYGYKRTKVPDLDDHLSFVNYDLGRFNARVFKSEEGLFVRFLSGTESTVKTILDYHGFQMLDS